MIPVVSLIRDIRSVKQTLGSIKLVGPSELFLIKTLELGWQNNESNISCISNGRYTCKWTRSKRLSNASVNRWLKKNPGKKLEDVPYEVRNIFTYEVLDVPNRGGIRIHSANYFFDLKGCIAMGSATKDINLDGELDIIHSGDTVRKFNAWMNYQDFTLDIQWAA